MVVAIDLLAIGVLMGIILAIVVWYLLTAYRDWERPPLIQRFGVTTQQPDDYWETVLESPRTPRENSDNQPTQNEPRSLSDRITRRLYPYYKHD